MIMQEHHSESLTDISPLFLFAIQRFFTRVFFYPHFLQAILLTRSYQRFIKIQMMTKQQTRMVFPFKEIYEVTYYNCVICSVVANNVLYYLELSTIQLCLYFSACLFVCLFVCFFVYLKDWSKKSIKVHLTNGDRCYGYRNYNNNVSTWHSDRHNKIMRF